MKAGDRIKVKFKGEGVVQVVGRDLARYVDDNGVMHYIPLEGLTAECWSSRVIEPPFEWKVGDIATASSDGSLEAKWLRVLCTDGWWRQVSTGEEMLQRVNSGIAEYKLVLRDGQFVG